MHRALNLETTVGQIVAENPSAARVFEKYRIDYCCRGDTTLRDACEQEHVGPATLLAEIDQALRDTAEIHWQGRKLSELAEHIVLTYHTYLRAELPRLDRLLQKAMEAHPQLAPTVWTPLQTVLREFTVDLVVHMNKEEAVLFPWIEELENAIGAEATWRTCDALRGPVETLEQEHREASETLDKIRQLTSDYQAPRDTCNTVHSLYQGLKALAEDLRIHVHLENNILFPRARNLERELLAREHCGLVQ